VRGVIIDVEVTTGETNDALDDHLTFATVAALVGCNV
jgi:hypothetical protein